MALLSIFSAKKSFGLPIIGSPLLNKLGLHILRIKIADFVLQLRRLQVAGFKRPDNVLEFKRDGILVIENFLPDSDFESLIAEISQTMEAVDRSTAIQSYGESGFGKKHHYDWGFDRFDGGTLNRFYSISPNHPRAQAFINHPRLRKLTAWLAGTYHNPHKYYLYKLRHGSQSLNVDSQKDIHRDTFHSAIKLWYFLEDVKPEHGPFHYAPGTHKMSIKRLVWERKRSIKASKENRGGAFRISPQELAQLSDGGLKSYPVKANTLVIADIRGFHCRGAALENQSRLSIYANIRPAPFLPAYNSHTLLSFVQVTKKRIKPS